MTGNNSIKIGYDLDGCIVDFVGGFFKWFNEPMPEILTWEQPFVNAHFKEIAHNKKFWLSLAPLIDPSELDGLPVYCYITARPVDPHISFKWLEMYGFPPAPVFGVGSNGAIHDTKTEIIKELGINYFIDDKRQHFDEINWHTTCTCFLMNRSWTEWEVAEPKINNYQELKELIYELA